VGDGFDPLRRFVSSMLQKKPELQIVCEATAGQKRFRKPKNCSRICLLNVGLSKLNGIGAARQIAKLAAESKNVIGGL
jgi:DNA-binding NarL/FixJ family response regulator